LIINAKSYVIVGFMGLKPHAIGLNARLREPIASEFIPGEMKRGVDLNDRFLSKFDLFIAIIFMGLKLHAIGLNAEFGKANSLGIHSVGD
jgi:hypothetical protein